jgi:hypothetical protein
VDREFIKKEVKWGRGQPDLKKGNCVYTRLHKNPLNESLLFTGDCKTKKKYICEVIYTNSY